MTPAAKRIELVIESRLDQTSLVGACLRALCLQSGVDETATYQVQTAVIEAVNNAVIHAYQNEAGHQVWVSWLKEGPLLSIVVSDAGRTMSALPPDCEPPVEAESGRGWWIMRQWMDEVGYERRDGRNAVVLRKRVG